MGHRHHRRHFCTLCAGLSQRRCWRIACFLGTSSDCRAGGCGKQPLLTSTACWPFRHIAYQACCRFQSNNLNFRSDVLLEVDRTAELFNSAPRSWRCLYKLKLHNSGQSSGSGLFVVQRPESWLDTFDTHKVCDWQITPSKPYSSKS